MKSIVTAIVMAIIGGLLWFFTQPPPQTPVERVADELFTQMLGKNSALFRSDVGLLPTFPGCSDPIYAQASTALIRAANAEGWDILERKALQAIVDDQGMVHAYRRDPQSSQETSLDLLQSQAVLVGNCLSETLHLRIIATNSVVLAAASGPFVQEASPIKTRVIHSWWKGVVGSACLLILAMIIHFLNHSILFNLRSKKYSTFYSLVQVFFGVTFMGIGYAFTSWWLF